MDRRTFLQSAGAGALALGTGGCSVIADAPRQTAATGAGATALASVPTLDNEYFTLWKVGGAEAADALDIGFRMQSYDDSAATQVSQLRSAASARANQVVTFPKNNDAVAELGRILAGQKIPFCTAFSTTPWSVPSAPGFKGGYAGLFYPREIIGQQRLAEAVFEQMGGEGNVVYVDGAETDRTSFLRKTGFKRALRKYPQIKLLASQYGNQNGQDTRPVVQAFLAKFDRIDAIVCHNSSEALGAVSVLEEKGIEDIKVAGTDEQDAILEKLVRGPNVTAVQSIFGSWLGGFAVVRNYDVGKGVELDPVERMLFQDGLVIDTKEAATEYRRIARRDTTGFDWERMSRSKHPKDWDSGVAIAPMDPTAFFAEDLQEKRPAGYAYPPALQRSLDGGSVKRLTQDFARRAERNPFAQAVSLTRSTKTVFGVSYA